MFPEQRLLSIPPSPSATAHPRLHPDLSLQPPRAHHLLFSRSSDIALLLGRRSR